ncbi:serine/threonine protein kinase [Actinomadura spongiicola]|uniref:non-specific serine/threonine protein kinase n=1 Tax=Actinomadura spongiicola TaxID=2303421 RepID=A0A372G6J6_9ACTN|nr:serine/threonine protein kinase [Actinomadura spongiicola]
MSFPPSVGRYRIERVLGSGAFASVWLGHDDALDSQVAIKVLSGSLIDDLDVRNRFLEEARILRRADSERLVRVHDIGELPDRRPYFVMSYADRGTLGDRMRERPLPVSEAIALAEEIAHGVEVINTLGVIHRDLKPSNVLFQSTPDGGEKLLIADLGLAKALAHASGAFTLPVGTPGYMSPEQARFGGGLDVRADVYGLGALTYHMVAGRPPGPAPIKAPPSERREGVPPEVDQVILRALEVEREKRWPTAEAFAEALSTLRPTHVPSPPAPRIDADATVQDFYRDGTRYQPPTPGQGAPAQGAPGQGAPGQGAPGQQEVSAGQAGPREMRTRLDQAGDDDIRTSEMRIPAGPSAPAANNEQTIVDDPGGRATPFGQGEPPTAPDHDNGRAGAMRPPYQAPPQQPGGQGDGGNDKTAVFPTQAPQTGTPQDASAPPMGPGGPPAHGGPQAPGGPQGPGGSQAYGGGQLPPPPTGFQAPPGPIQGGGQGQGQGSGGMRGLLGKLGGGASGKFATPLVITVVVLAVALVGGLILGVLFSGDDGGGKGEKKTPSIPKDFVAISDDAGKIKAAVPKAWPKATQESTWTPSTVNLNDAQPRPVLRATPDKAAFLGNGKGPGVFIGVTTDLRPGQLPPPSAASHSQCTKADPEDYTTPDKALTGTITRFTACKVGTPTVTEVGLRDKSGKFGLWIRVKETDDRGATKDILDSLKVTGP